MMTKNKLREILKIEWPKWKTIRLISPSGRCVMDDATVAKKISNVQLSIGDKVLVYQDQILKIHWEDLRYIPLPPVISYPLIICYIGDTTVDFCKNYYELIGNQIIDRSDPSGWTLTDDGKYGLIWDGVARDDPDGYNYRYDAGGLGVACGNSGIPAKQQSGKTVRFILNQAIEDELWEGFIEEVVWTSYDYTFNFLLQVDSLSYAPYKFYGNKPFMMRYTPDYLVSMHIVWSGQDTTLYYRAFISDNFNDTIPVISNIYRTQLQKQGGVKIVENVEIADYSNGDDAIIAVCQNQPLVPRVQSLIRAKEWNWSGSNMAEPIRKELYDMRELIFLEDSDTLHRCADPESNYCYMVDAWLISGKTYNNYFTVLSGQQTIANDIKLPYGLKENGALDYIRLQKDTEFTQHNCGVYCNDTLIEESGMQNVIKLYGDNSPLIAEYMAPLLIRQTSYRFLHAYHDDNFNVVFYRKTVYLDHSSELLPYKAYRASPINAYCQVRRTLIRSKTTYHIAVNGKITDLDYGCINREYRLTVLSEEYTGDPIDSVHGYVCRYPWLDVGYDKDGTELVEEINRNITRIFTDATKDKLLLSFDVFPAKFRHDLVYDEHDNLTLEYDEDIAAWPPASDGIYEQVSDRKWFLFDTGGSYQEIQPPQIFDNGAFRNINRVNGLCILAGQ